MVQHRTPDKNQGNKKSRLTFTGKIPGRKSGAVYIILKLV